KVDAQLGRVLDVERVFGIDKCAGAADFLHFGNDLQRERGLAGRLGPVDFDHAAAWQAADPQRDVEPQRAGRHDLDVMFDLVVAIAHDRTPAELLVDLRQGCGRRLGLFRCGCLAGFVVHVVSRGGNVCIRTAQGAGSGDYGIGLCCTYAQYARIIRETPCVQAAVAMPGCWHPAARRPQLRYLPRMRILIAEDDSILADGLSRSLRHNGYAVDAVSDGIAADSALAAQAFDLLILDLGLPHRAGLAVLRRLRARQSL